MAKEWKDNSFFCFVKDSFFQYQDLVQKQIDHLHLPLEQKKRVSFWTHFILDALSPSNFPFTNPEILQAIIKESGANLHRGLQNFIQDLSDDALVFPPLADSKAFQLGKDIASTPGRVVFENSVFQLIQYDPILPMTHETPLLIIPAWINKYYLFDLTKGKSFVRFNLSRGRTVFIVSWVNPQGLSPLTMRDYLDSGIQESILQTYRINKESLQAIGSSDQVPLVNVVAMCASGTFLITKILESVSSVSQTCGCALQSATLLMTPFNFRCLDWIQLFFPLREFHSFYLNFQKDPEGLSNSRTKSGTKSWLNSFFGQYKKFFPGELLTKAFCCLRANDLIWPHFVTRYWLGQDLKSFDFLYWNDDAPRLPLPMLYDYIETFCVQNAFFSRSGPYNFHNRYQKVPLPMFVVGAEKDHLVPWPSCFSIAQKFPNATFVLSGSGHIAGCINPPSSNKYHYYTGSSQSCNRISQVQAKAQVWLQSASYHPGSWWNEWDRWLGPFDGKIIQAFSPGLDGERAPGTYALSA